MNHLIIKYDPRAQLIHQLNSWYGNICSGETVRIDAVYNSVIERMEKCFSHIKNKYYCSGRETIFNPHHVAQWTMFLYTVGNELSKNGDTDLCDKIYGLSKIVSSADIFYGVEMPEIYFFDHPQGSVLGRAKYSNYFSFSQGCTVGNNKGVYPSFGEHVSMMSNSKVLGCCNVGHHVILSANSYIIDQDVPPYSIVFGMGKDVIIKSITLAQFNELTASMF